MTRTVRGNARPSSVLPVSRPQGVRTALSAWSSPRPSRRTRSAYAWAAEDASRSAAEPAAATNVPLRPRVSITPSPSSARYALATVFTASPSDSASPRTVGSRYPTGSAPDRACSEICARTCSYGGALSSMRIFRLTGPIVPHPPENGRQPGGPASYGAVP